MKKYFAYAAAAIMMVACNVEELETSDVQENGKINLTVSVNTAEDATRAKSADALQNQMFVSGKTILVEAYETGAATPYASGIYTTGEAGALTGGLYYPANNGAIDICAYYPSDITRSSTSFAVQTNQASEADYQASDLMYATKLTGKSSGTTHGLTFNHSLTKIVVNITLHASITNENLTTHPTVTAVKINSTKPNATLSITNGAIAVSGVTGDAADISVMGTGLDNMGIIVPQSVAADADFITISYNGSDYTYKLPEAKTFAAGKVYTYELTLTARGLELQTTQITNWDTQTGGSHGITI